MKRLMILLAVLLACCAVAGAEDAAPTATPDSVVEGGYATSTPTPTPELPPLRDDPMLLNIVEIAHRIDILAENERFMLYYTGLSAKDAQVEAVSYGDHSRPARVFHLSGQTLIDALYAGADASQMLDFTRLELRRDLVDELPEILWGRREEAELSLLYTLARYKVFAMEGASGCGVFFLLYENAAPVVVTWIGASGCIQAAGYFMPDAALAAVTDADALSAWFAGAGMPAVAFEEVPLI